MSRPLNRISPDMMRAVLAHILHDGERHGRLAAAGFADDADRLARHHRQVEVDHRRDLAGAREVGDAEVLAFEDRGLRRSSSGHPSVPQADLAQAVGQQIEARGSGCDTDSAGTISM